MDLIILNVSGTRFEMEKLVFMKIPLFAKALADSGNFPNKELWIPRSPLLFQHILALAIDDDYPYPEEHCKELEYYGIDAGDVSLIRRDNDNLERLFLVATMSGFISQIIAPKVTGANSKEVFSLLAMIVEKFSELCGAQLPEIDLEKMHGELSKESI